MLYFLGGAFVGAAPQITYRLFLELLAAQGCAVVTVPYATGFDHQQIADSVHYGFTRCLQRLEPALQVGLYGLKATLAWCLACAPTIILSKLEGSQ